MGIEKLISQTACSKAPLIEGSVVKKLQKISSTNLPELLDKEGGVAMGIEALAQNNKTYIELIQKTDEPASVFDKIKTIIPQGKDFYFNEKGKLCLDEASIAEQKAKKAYFYKYESQISDTEKSIQTFQNRLDTLFDDFEKAQIEEISNLSQKRINPRRLSEAQEFIGIGTSKTDDELKKSAIEYVEKRRGKISDEDAKKLVELFKGLNQEKLKDQYNLTVQLQNAQTTLQQDKKAFQNIQQTLEKKSEKETQSIVDELTGDTIFRSVDAKGKELDNETVKVTKQQLDELKNLSKDYDFLNLDNSHALHRLFQRYGKQGDTISIEKIKEVLDKISQELNKVDNKLMTNTTDEGAKIGVFLSKGSTSRGGVSLLIPNDGKTFDNIIFDRNAKIHTIISDISSESAKSNFVPRAHLFTSVE